MSSDDEIVAICYGDADPGDTHLFARIVAQDEEIIAWCRYAARISRISR